MIGRNVAEVRRAVLDIPVPPSVNRTRKIDWRGHKDYAAWKKEAGWRVAANGQYRNAPRDIRRYELTITLNDALCKRDPDNVAKHAIDLLRSLEIITDDSPEYARRIIIEWGDVPIGCRLTLQEVA